MKQCAALIIIAVTVIISAGCYSKNDYAQKEPYKREMFALDTIISFTIYNGNAQEVSELSEELIKTLEKQLSVTDENSEINRMNNASEPVKVSQDTFNVMKTACEVYELSEGSLDPTIYPIVKLWGFTTGENRVPTSNEIQKTIPLVNASVIVLNESNLTITVPKKTELDLGAVAKGYISQKVKELMKENGVESAVLSFGGNIQTIGQKNGEPWKIGVKYPFTQDSFIILDIGETAIITSATDQRYFTHDGKSYHHIIDPKNGYPVENGTLSVTVVCKDGTKADALSTALFVMGQKRAEEYWRKNGGFEYLLLDDNSNVYVTSGLKNKMKLSEEYDYLKLNFIE